MIGLAGASLVFAQEPPTSASDGRRLTTIGEFWSTPLAERNRPLPFSFECEVLFYDAAWQLLWVRDASGPEFVFPGSEPLPIKHGDRVRVTGVLPAPNVDLTFEGASFEVLKTTQPAPVEVGSLLLQSPLFDNQFVEVEALVDQQSMADPTHIELVLSREGRAFRAWVLHEAGSEPPGLVGRNIRVRGVYGSQVSTRGRLVSFHVMVPGIGSIEVLSGLEEDPRFEIPAVAVRDLPRVASDSRVRVVGELHAQTAGQGLYLRDTTGQVEVLSGQSLILRPREAVEAIGFPVTRGTVLRLEDGVYRRRRDGDAEPDRIIPAAAPVAPSTTVTSIRQFLALSPGQRVEPCAIQLDCTVLHYDPYWRQLWIGDESAGAYGLLGERPLPIKSGQRVRVSGTSSPPNTHLSFAELNLVVLGEASVAAVPLGDWREFNPMLVNRMVYAEGLVDRQTTSIDDKTHLRLFLSVDGRLVVAWVMREPREPVPDFAGSIVRVSGIYNPKLSATGSLNSLELMVPGMDRIEILGNLATDPRFYRPAVSIEDLRSLPPDRVVRVVGEVRSQQAGRYVRLRDDTGQVEVISAQTTGLAVREMVEAIGQPRVEGVDVQLTGALFRRAQAQEPAATDREVTGLRLASDVLELSPEEAERRLPVRVSGVVVWSHPDYPYLYLQDSTGGVRVRRGADPNKVRPPGRSVDVQGVTVMGRFAPEILATEIVKTGDTVVPDSRTVSLEHALTGVEESQWVMMHGYLRACERRTNELGLEEQVLELATSAGDFEAILPTREDLTSMIGAVIGLHGVCTVGTDDSGKLTGIQLRVPDASFLQVEEAAPQDVFETPARSVESLGRFATTQAFNRRVKVEGTVLHSASGRFVIHQGGGALIALTRESVPPQPGDRIEAVGFLGRQGTRVVLREAVFRRVASGELPVPRQLQNLVPVDPANDNRLVRISGTVLDDSYVGSTLGLTVQHGAAVFPAYLDAEGFEIEKGSRVELTGIYDVRFDEYGRPRSFGLLLRNRDDLRVVARPSWFTTRRLLAITGGLVLVTAVIMAWLLALRRRVRLQTEQIRVQLQRESHLQGELERALRLESLGLLAGGIAHDFNNLLTVVMGNLSLARFADGIDRETRDSLGDAERAVKRARDLTQQLLTFSKGGAPIRTAVNLSDVVLEVTRFVLRGSTVRPEFDIEAGLWTADVDKGQIGQVVQNIVINGAQAMPDGGRLDLSLANERREDVPGAILAAGRHVRLTVTDHGAGIDAVDLPRIFDPYFTTKTKGSGLGLATTYSIVKRHGGHIDVESTIGSGTTFRVWLPASDAPSEPPAAASEPVAEIDDSGGDRVLVMDDEPAIRRLTQAILGRAGYRVTAVGDGADAVREYVAAREAGRGYSLVIFDLTVPGGMGGRQAFEELLKVDPAVKAIVSSGYSNDPCLAEHRAVGFAAMVAKPYDVATLLETVRVVLRGDAE